MIGTILSATQKGEPLPLKQLRQWFDLAVIKKMGVLKQPYHCWPNDPKINPELRELFWGSLLLADAEAQSLVQGIMQAEEEEMASHQHREASPVETMCRGYAEELLALKRDVLPKELSRQIERYC